MVSGVGAVVAKNTFTSMRERPSGGGVGGGQDQGGLGGLEVGVQLVDGTDAGSVTILSQ